MSTDDWAGYLAGFHAERPGIRPRRRQAGRRVVRRWVGPTIAVPLRRIVARLPG